MSRDTDQSEDPGNTDADSTRPPSRFGAVFSLACAICGCVVWLIAWWLLDPCGQGEQLARFFAALFNVLFLTAAGSVATTMLIIALVISRRLSNQKQTTLLTLTKVVALLGLLTGTVILIVYLPGYLSILH